MEATLTAGGEPIVDEAAKPITLRQEALAIAIELFGEETSAEDAADLVAAAKVFEAYLKGE
jgi:hypothetical protein